MRDVVSFVIRTKNEAESLEKACNLIRKQKGDFESEIIVVDSGSTDNTMDIAYKVADITIEIPEKDFSWGYSLNAGIGAANGKYIFLLSAHCFFTKEDSVRCGIYILEKENMASLYGMQIGDPNKNIYECVELMKEYPNIDLETSKYTNIHGISNACCLLKKEIWDNNPFNETLQSSEDYEWYRRIINQGYSVGYTCQIELVHGHYLNPAYVYKKDYWREYTGRICMDAIFKGIFGSKVYIFMNRFLHIFKAFKEYHFYLNKLKLAYSDKNLLKYLSVKDLAIAKARIDVRRKKSDCYRYEDIDVPLYVKKMNVR